MCKRLFWVPAVVLFIIFGCPDWCCSSVCFQWQRAHLFLMTLLPVYKIWLLQSTRTSLPWRLLFYTFRSSSNHKSEGGKISQDAANHSTVIVDILKESLTNTTKEFNEVLTTRTKVRFMSSIAYFSPLFHSFMQLRHSRIYTIICRSWGSIKTEEIFSHCQLQLQGTDQILPSSRVNHLSP